MGNEDPLETPPFLDRRPREEINKSGGEVDQPTPDDMPSEEAADSEAQDPQSEGTDQADLKPHPYANMFPRMQDREFDDLVTSIKEDGLEEHIVKFEGKILDGRNRYAACIEAGVDPEFDEYEGNDPLGFVLRKNIHRRHLNTSQRAMIAANMADLNNGQRADEVSGTSIDVAAKKLSVGRATVDRAKAVQASGNEALIQAVESGKKSVSAAFKALAQPSAPVEALPDGKQQSRKLLKLWDKTGEDGRNLFLEGIGAGIVASGEEE